MLPPPLRHFLIFDTLRFAAAATLPLSRQATLLMPDIEIARLPRLHRLPPLSRNLLHIRLLLLPLRCRRTPSFISLSLIFRVRHCCRLSLMHPIVFTLLLATRGIVFEIGATYAMLFLRCITSCLSLPDAAPCRLRQRHASA